MIQYRNDEIRIERGIKTWLKIDSPKREKSARTNVIHGSLMKTRSTRVDSPSRIIKRRVLLKNTLSFFPRSTIQSNRSNSPSNGRRKSSNRQKSRISVVAENCRPPRWIKKREREREGEKKTFFSRVEKKGINMKSGGAGEREPAIIDTRRTRVCSLNVDSIRIRADSNDVRPGFYEFPREQFSSTWISKRRSFISMRPNFPSTLQIVFLLFSFFFSFPLFGILFLFFFKERGSEFFNVRSNEREGNLRRRIIVVNFSLKI